MTRVVGVAAAVALAVALAGCSDAEPAREVRSGGNSPTTVAAVVSTAPSGPTSTPISTAPPTNPGEPGGVEPSPLPSDPTVPPAGDALPPATTIPGDSRQPHQWENYSVGADGTTLSFTYYAGVAPCSVFDSITAEETATTVRVTIYEHGQAGEGVVCIMMAQLKSASVTLEAPLGGRLLVDGAR